MISPITLRYYICHFPPGWPLGPLKLLKNRVLKIPFFHNFRIAAVYLPTAGFGRFWAQLKAECMYYRLHIIILLCWCRAIQKTSLKLSKSVLKSLNSENGKIRVSVKVSYPQLNCFLHIICALLPI